MTACSVRSRRCVRSWNDWKGSAWTRNKPSLTKMDKASEQLRKKYMSRRWQIQKVSQKLVTRGFVLKHSKFLGESMFHIMEKEPDGGAPIGADVSGLDEDRALVDATEETFDITKIVVWNANARGDLMQRNSNKVAFQGCRTGQEDAGESSMGWRDGRCQRFRIW